MSTLLRSVCVAVALLSRLLVPAFAQDKEQADNPFYKFWSKSKVGASVTLKETTKLTGPAAGGREAARR